MKKLTVFPLLSFVALTIVLALGCSENSIQEPSVSMDAPDPGESMFGGGTGSGDIALAEDDSEIGTLVAIQGDVEAVDYNTLKLEEVLTFSDVDAAVKPGIHHESMVMTGCAGIAERFEGQTRTTVMVGNYPHDDLSGTPTGPLTLASGAPGENVGVATETTCGPSEVLVGWGPLGYPLLWGGGEGSIAILFANDQSEFGLRMCGGNAGHVTFQFFGRDGSLLATAVVYRVREDYFGFRRVGGAKDIAGVSIHNVDVGGVAIDDLTFDVNDCNIADGYHLDIKPTSCPNPLNMVGGGTLPVAILGSEDADVMDIDVSTVMLEELSPLRYEYEDVAAPVMEPEPCECTTAGPDGFMDVTFKFDKGDLVDVLGPMDVGTVVPLTLTAYTLEGRIVELQDCMVIVRGSPEVDREGGGGSAAAVGGFDHSSN
jgi:hypothetical protein